MKITTLSRLVGAVNAFFLLALVSISFYSLSLQHQGAAADERLLQSDKLAGELLQSSENLTRMARTYVETGNPIYKTYYFAILGIRNGTVPRPGNYDATYWNLAGGPNSGSSLVPTHGERISLEELMKRAGFTDDELALLRSSEDESNQLVKTESKAFAVLEGRYDTGQGKPAVQGLTDREYARSLLYDQAYQSAKYRIMKPIERFMQLVDRRTRDTRARLVRLRDLWLEIGIVVALLLLAGVLSGLYIGRLVLIPLRKLRDQIESVSSGDYTARNDIRRGGEFSSLGTNLNTMTKRLGEWQSQLEAQVTLRGRQVEETAAALSRSEDLFHAAFKTGPDAYVIVGQEDGRFVEVNDEFESMFGYSRDEVLGKTSLELGFWADPRRRSELLQELAAKGQVRDFEVFAKRKNGETFEALYSVTRLETTEKSLLLEVIHDVTEQRSMEAALTSNEVRLRRLSDNLPDGFVYQLDADERGGNRRFIYVSAGVEALHEVSPEAVMRDSATLYGQIVEEDLSKIQDLEIQSMSNMSTFRAEARFRVPSGTIRWGLLTSAPRRAPNGHIIWDGVEIDITLRKQAEEEVRRLMRVYTILSKTNELIIRTHELGSLLEGTCQIAANDGKFRLAWIGTVNREIGKIERTASAGEAQAYLDTLDIDLGDELQSYGPTGRVIRSAAPVISNNIANDSSMTPWKASALRFGLGSAATFPITVFGSVWGVFSVCSAETSFFNEDEVALFSDLAMDISFAIEGIKIEGERRRAATELRESEERFRTLIDKTLVGVYLIQNNRLEYVNDSLAHVFGYERSELVGSDPLTIIHPDDRAYVTEEMRMRLAGKEAETPYQIRGLTKTGDVRHLELIGTRVELNGNAAILGNLIDVTERGQLEEQLRRTQRLESIGSLASGIAHDLNNVLTPILLGVEVLSGRSIDERGKYVIENMRQSAMRGSQIVKQVLAIARGTEGEYRPQQLRYVIKEIESFVRQTFPKNIELNVDVTKDLPAILGDATELHQILLNLCVNARDAMPHGGRILIKASREVLNASELGSNVEAGTRVCLSIADTGAGIPEEIQSKIFDPFFTTKEAGKGTGLGLATVHSIVQSHNAFLRLSSAPGQGTEFKIYFPVIEDEALTSGDTEETHLPRGNGECILFVDDEHSVLQMAKETLEAYNYRVISASEGVEASILFSLEPPGSIAVVVTDINMPRMNGTDLAKVITATQPAVKVLMISGSPDETAARKAGFITDSFLAKPFSTEELLRAIAGLLEERAGSE